MTVESPIPLVSTAPAVCMSNSDSSGDMRSEMPFDSVPFILLPIVVVGVEMPAPPLSLTLMVEWRHRQLSDRCCCHR